MYVHDRYDIPAKAADHVRLGESEQMFEYLICAVCPVTGDYEAGSPECGFLFPSYAEGGALMNCIDIYQSDVLRPTENWRNCYCNSSVFRLTRKAENDKISNGRVLLYH